jgi:hypothetical protein
MSYALSLGFDWHLRLLLPVAKTVQHCSMKRVSSVWPGRSFGAKERSTSMPKKDLQAEGGLGDLQKQASAWKGECKRYVGEGSVHLSLLSSGN